MYLKDKSSDKIEPREKKVSETESSGSTGTVDNASKTSGESEVGVINLL